MLEDDDARTWPGTPVSTGPTEAQGARSTRRPTSAWLVVAGVAGAVAAVVDGWLLVQMLTGSSELHPAWVVVSWVTLATAVGVVVAVWRVPGPPAWSVAIAAVGGVAALVVLMVDVGVLVLAGVVVRGLTNSGG